MPVNPETVLNHYLCYPIDNDGFRPPHGVEAADQFLNDLKRPITILRRDSLWIPVTKNHKKHPFPEAHLVCYVAEEPKSIRKWVRMSNQFDFETPYGEQNMEAQKLIGLCVPTGKSLKLDDRPPPIPDNVSHFLCYSTQGVLNTFPVNLDDQIYTTPTKFTVRPPDRLCNPADKFVDGKPSPRQNNDAHLVCYPVTPPPGFKAQKVLIHNQFETARVTIEQPNRLCVPSLKQLLPGPPVPHGR
jgi:hypothetical protein